jgi:hypothetical protein
MKSTLSRYQTLDKGQLEIIHEMTFKDYQNVLNETVKF